MAARLEARQNPVGAAKRRVDALETLRRWASGDTVTEDLLRDTLATLAAGHGPSPRHDRILADQLDDWAQRHGLDLHPQCQLERTRTRVGLEIGL